MKKIILIFCILFAMISNSFSVFAEEVLEKEKVNVYFFKRTGCPHCMEAEEFFESIEGKYGAYFNIVSYDIYGNEENSNLMDKVSKKLKDKANGVPYIIVGKKSFIGYDEAIGKQLIDAIEKEYNSENRYDLMEHIDEKEPRNGMIDFIVIGGIILVTGIIIYERYQNK